METLIRGLAEHGSLWVFVLVLLARAGAPVPGGPVLVIAGSLAALGQLSMALVVVLSLLANLLGDAVWFAGGRRYGYRVMQLLCRISLSPDTCVRQSEGLFTRWGGVSLVAAKFVPGVSVVAAPMAGALRMSWQRFVAWDLAAAAVWTAAYLMVGVLFRTQVRDVLAVLADAGTKALLGLLLLAAAVLAVRWLRRKAMATRGDALRISAAQLQAWIEAGRTPALLDVRGSLARDASGMVPGAKAVDFEQLAGLAPSLVEQEVVVYCNCPNDASAMKAAQMLQALGVAEVRVLAGGYDGWLHAQVGVAAVAAA